MKRFLIIIACFLTVLSACEKALEPNLSNEKTEEQLLANPELINGILTTAYAAVASKYDAYGNDFLDCATDNAVSNNLNGSMNRLVSLDGYWTSQVNPINTWGNSFNYLRHVNQFLEIGTDSALIYIKSDSVQNVKHKARILGEAYFLRAWIQFQLLQKHAGLDEMGNVLGYPIVTKVYNFDDFEQLARDPFHTCVDSIVGDVTRALAAGLPDVYSGKDIVLGAQQVGRPTNVACKALKSRVLLYAASPAYTVGLSDSEKQARWEAAATAAHDVLIDIGYTLPNSHMTKANYYFNNPEDDEIIMRRIDGAAGGNNDTYKRNFPPLLYGNGTCNPSQNLVDAFPMADGTPYEKTNDANMYIDRDPRFYMTILYNGATFKDSTLEMFQGGNSMDGAANGLVTAENSTRSGYYLRKWMSSKGYPHPEARKSAKDLNYYALFRKGEIFLNFAEAANEAYGPTDATPGLSAKQAIAEVRKRAGIAKGGTDTYLNDVSISKEKLRKLIKNERRIELCFEGHRFFDLRRWMDNINEDVMGITVENNTGTITYTRKKIYTPVYKEHMYYCPIPFTEALKVDLIKQNKGWF